MLNCCGVLMSVLRCMWTYLGRSTCPWTCLLLSEPSLFTHLVPAPPASAASAAWAGWAWVCLKGLKVRLISLSWNIFFYFNQGIVIARMLKCCFVFICSSSKLRWNSDRRAEAELSGCPSSPRGAGRTSLCLYSRVPLPAPSSVLWGKHQMANDLPLESQKQFVFLNKHLFPPLFPPF